VCPSRQDARRGWSAAEIAKRLGIEANAVQVNLHHARRTMKASQKAAH
jgi:DNA-directed RNA polymerase specialized sigma24 family protein